MPHESRGLPVTSGYHTHFDQYSRHYGPSWLMPWVTRWLDGLHRRCQATFVPTPELAAQLHARGIPNVRAVGRGVDTRLFHPDRRDPALRARWGLAAEDLACLYVGRLAPEKNLEVVEQAFAAIALEHPRARMVWVGDGPSLPSLHKAHPDHIFTGPRVGEELASHYASADLFLFGSLSETWGNVLTEALASGLPVLAYRRAAAERLIRNGENGMTVEARHGHLHRDGDRLGRRQEPEPTARPTGQPVHGGHGWEAIIERFEMLLRECAATRA
jgi:glycosyltransferase involved in cell wall biosynthesis